MKRKILDFSVMKEEISQNNVLEMAELIAFMELRFLIGYLGSRAQKMYADLYGDIKHKNELGYMLSDSYDLVQEGALYLCEHYGRHLNDVIGCSKKGKPITVEIACIRKMMKLINRKTSDYYRTVSLDALTPVSEPSYEKKKKLNPNEGKTVDNIVWPFYRYSALIPKQIGADLFVWLYLSLVILQNRQKGLPKDSYTDEVTKEVEIIILEKFSSVIDKQIFDKIITF